MAELDEDVGPKILMDKISKIDKIEERQARHTLEIKEIKSVLANTEMDGRLTKVEKRQEVVMEEIKSIKLNDLKEIRNDIRKVEDTCDKQRTTCLASVAPITFIADMKQDLKRIEERLQQAHVDTRNETKLAYNENNKWTRWAFILSMLACIISSVSCIGMC